MIDPEVGERRRWMMTGASIGISVVVSHQSRARPRLKYTTDILILFASALLILPLFRPHLILVSI